MREEVSATPHKAAEATTLGTDRTEERVFEPIHPGEILAEEFLEPLGMTAYGLARDISVPAPRIYDIVKGERGVSTETALRLSRYFGNSARFWLNLQAQYDLETEEDRVGERIEREVKPRAGLQAATA